MRRELASSDEAHQIGIMTSLAMRELKKLSSSEKLQLVETLWDEIAAADSGVIQLTPTQKRELDRRLAAFKKNPSEGQSWPKVRQRILRRA